MEPLESRIAPANLAYAFGLGGSKNESIQDIAVDASGNTYVSGTFQGTVDFDPGPGVTSRTAPAGSQYGFVAKYTSGGAFAWLDTVAPMNAAGPSSGSLSEVHLAVTSTGDVYLSTDFTSPKIGVLDSTGVAQSAVQDGTASNLLVAKLTSTGIARWAVSYGTQNPVGVTEDDIATDGAGGLYIVGKFNSPTTNSSVTFGGAGGPTLAARAGDDNLYVLKLNDLSAGVQVVWANSTTSTGVVPSVIDHAFIAVDASGQAGVAGKFHHQLTFGTAAPTTVSDSLDGLFVGRLDASGNWTLAGQFGPDGADRDVTGIAIDSQSHMFVAGEFGSPTDFDISAADHTLSPPDREGFMVRIRPGGTLDFAFNHFGPTNGPTDTGAVAVDAAGYAYVTYFNGNPFVLRYDPFGNSEKILDLPGVGVNDSFSGIAVDAAGGLHFAGTFTGSADFDPALGKTALKSKGGTDAFVASYFPGLGQDLQPSYVTQALTIGSTGADLGRQVLTDPVTGDFYVAGLFNGTVDFDPGAGVTNLTSKAGADYNIFIAKYTSAGTLAWAQPVEMDYKGGEGPDVAFALDGSGNVYLTGEYFGQATLGAFTITNANPPGGLGVTDIFVAKLDSAGTFQWAKTLSGPDFNEFVTSIAVRGSTGQVVIGGLFSNTVDFDPGPGTASQTAVSAPNNYDAFILSLDTSGTFQWVRHLGGSFASEPVNSLAFTSGGDVVAAGSFNGTVDFNLGGTSAPLSTALGNAFTDAYVARFAGGTGIVTWEKQFGGDLIDNGNGVAIGAGDAIYVGGDFAGSVDFDPTAATKVLVSSGSEANGTIGDAFLLSLASDGTFQNVVGFGGPGQDSVGKLIVGATGDVFAAGTSGGNTDFDPGLGLATLSPASPFLARFTGTLGFLNATPLPEARAAVDAQGYIFVTGSFSGTTDLDPSATKASFTSKGGTDLFVVKLSADNVFNAAHPRSFRDADGDLVTLQLTGPGTATYTLIGGAQHLADLAELDLAGTDLTTSMSVNVTKFSGSDGTTSVQKILTAPSLQNLGSLLFGPTVTLGDGLDDAIVDLHVSGKLNTLTLGDLAAHTIIRLGDTLPYLDTYNNRPTVTIGNVLGDGVQLNVIGDGVTKGILGGIGGGGLGNVVIGSWAYAGFIRTTQSIGNFTVLNAHDEEFLAVLEVDKSHLGSETTANVGHMTISSGSWGSSGSEIEGDVASFDAAAFLAGATLTAANFGAVNVHGDFAGTITTTTIDPDSPAIPTFTVSSDFTGIVISAAAIKKLKIRGDFMGSLQAPSIGSITAYSFRGAPGVGGPTTFIKATDGALGTITSTAGPITDFSIQTSLVFKGFKVSLSKLSFDTTGINNVHITAASIGNISVSLKAAPNAGAIRLIGIRDSDFVTTATGASRATAGSIGSVSVSITGASAGLGSVGIQNSTFDALVGSFPAPTSSVNALGNISVKLSGQGGGSLGFDGVSFAANNIGTTTVSVNRAADAATTAQGIDTADYTASGTIGAINVSGNATAPQVTALKILAGRSVGAVTIKSTDPLGGANGTLEDSAILAGQLLTLAPTTDPNATAATKLARLALAKLGAVNVSGSITNTDLIAGGSIGTVTVGKNMTDSLVLAGARLGGDFVFDGDESYQRVAGIAAVTVRGALTKTSIAAGIDPGTDHVFGTGDDALAAAVSHVAGSSSIGLISVFTGTINHSPGATHQYAIEAGTLSGIKVGTVSTIALPVSLDQATTGDDPSDIVVRSFPSAAI